MKLQGDQLTCYLESMNEKAKKALEADFRIHGFMIYRCIDCNSIYVMWLAEGLEDHPIYDARTGKHKPVPFGIICPVCGGSAFHNFWTIGECMLGKNHRSYKDYISQQNKLIYKNFFWNDPENDCGTPIIFNVDYYPQTADDIMRCVNSIAINTYMINLSRDENVDQHIFIAEPTLDGLRNRHERRHPDQHEGYKRPKKNKKLYEY